MGLDYKDDMTQHEGVFDALRQCLLDLNLEYTLSEQAPEEVKNARFALGIVRSLLKHRNVLTYVNPLIKQDLSDSIGLHHGKYVEILEKSDMSLEASELVAKSQELLEIMALTVRHKDNVPLERQEVDIIKEITTNIAQKCRGLFAEQSYNQEAIDKLQAAAIAFNIGNLEVACQVKLFDRILSVKELWQCEPGKSAEHNNFRQSLHLHLGQILQQIDSHEQEEAFGQFLRFLVQEKGVLAELSNKAITHLYDRLKNMEPYSENLGYLLNRLHRDAQFRYTYNRLSDSGYELLKRFESYDAMIHQIDISEFAIVEAFLLRHNNFVQESIVCIAKHLDNIKVVGAVKIPELGSALTKIKNELSSVQQDANSSTATVLASIRTKLPSPLDPHVLKRYSELDKFCINTIKNRYTQLFRNIITLINRDETDPSFIQQIVVKRLAQDYYIANLSNSVAKLRQMAVDRAYIASSLAEIDFVALFAPENLNTITSLNFKKPLSRIEIKNKNEYINAVINVIVSSASASQLEAIYRPMVGAKLTEIGTLLKQAISKQVKQRTTLSKTIYSIFTGKKQELATLKSIKKNFSQKNNEMGLAADLNDIKKLPSEIQDDIEEIAKEVKAKSGEKVG